MIVAIAGGARTGKTTLGLEMALRSGTDVLGTDTFTWSLRHLPDKERWSAVSQAVAARILTARADLIVEGVAVARALRKVLDQSTERPCDHLIVLCSVRREAGVVSKGIVVQAKGVWTVLGEIWSELKQRGATVEMRGSLADVRAVEAWIESRAAA